MISEKQGKVGKKREVTRDYALIYERKDRSMNEVARCVHTAGQMGAVQTALTISVQLHLSHAEKRIQWVWAQSTF